MDEDDKQKKKVLHRDLERQRRQEMSNLYASLRNLLPVEYIKGKRAVSDHVTGAVSYINDTQQRIKEMSEVRDGLRREFDTSKFKQGSSSGHCNQEPATVAVNPCQDGVEIVINSAASGLEALPLSRVLQVLRNQGLEVISSLSTRVDERLMHTIQIEIAHLMFFDVEELQRKLIEDLFFIG